MKIKRRAKDAQSWGARRLEFLPKHTAPVTSSLFSLTDPTRVAPGCCEGRSAKVRQDPGHPMGIGVVTPAQCSDTYLLVIHSPWGSLEPIKPCWGKEGKLYPTNLRHRASGALF